MSPFLDNDPLGFGSAGFFYRNRRFHHARSRRKRDVGNTNLWRERTNLRTGSERL